MVFTGTLWLVCEVARERDESRSGGLGEGVPAVVQVRDRGT